MTCYEFRTRMNLALDGHSSPDEWNALAVHRAACPHCSIYADSLDRLDLDLHALPEIDVPADILDLVRPQPAPARFSPGWRPEILRGARILLPGLALWGISLLLAGTGEALFSLLLLVLGLTPFFSSALGRGAER